MTRMPPLNHKLGKSKMFSLARIGGKPLFFILLSGALSIFLTPVALSSQVIQVEGAQVAPVGNPIVPEKHTLLQGEVSDVHYAQLEQRFNELTNIAIERREDTQELNRKHKHFNGILSRTWHGTRDIIELCTEYQGFEQSSEAADIILGEKLKIKSKASADYVKQMIRDQTERNLLCVLMQLAEGLGVSDQEQSQAEVEQGMSRLKELVGDSEAENTLKVMKEWSQSIGVEPVNFSRRPWNILEAQQQTKSVLDKAMKHDSVVSEIKTTLHKRYNQRSNLARVTAKVMNAGLSIAAFSPTLISPAAQLAWTVYIATQGGPEESKLLKEVYWAKRFESRYVTLNAYSTLAVNSYNTAIMTKNGSLLAMSDWLMNRIDEADKQTASGMGRTIKIEPTDPDLAAEATETARTIQEASLVEVVK